MKKVINQFLAMMGMMSAVGADSYLDFSTPIEPAQTPAPVKHSKPRFVAGDHFYKHLSMKRIKGKWRCER